MSKRIPQSECQNAPSTWSFSLPARFPTRVTVESIGELTLTPGSQGGEDGDFFSSWNKPATPKSPAFISSKPTPPVLGRSLSTSASIESPPTTPRTVSSSSFRSTSSTGGTGARPVSKLGASRLTSSSGSVAPASAGSAPKKSKLGGLGAKKAAAPLDFAEAERRAAEEAERVKQLGYDREQEKAEEEAKAKEAMTPISAKPLMSAKVVPNTPVSAGPKGNVQDMERLGMGMKRLGFGAAPAASTSKPYVGRVYYLVAYRADDFVPVGL